MSDEDPLAALSAAAKSRSPGGRPGYRPGAKPMPRPGAGRLGSRGPHLRKKSNPYVLPIFIVLAMLAAGITVGIVVKVEMTVPPPAVVKTEKPKPVVHPPGELFKNVPGQ